MKSKALVIGMLGMLALPAIADARGRCNGYERCRCGVTAAKHAGLPVDYKGFNLKRAVEWKRAFPRTSPGPGVVVYQRGGGPSGHVSTIVRYDGDCTALVKDDAGTYERNICIRGAVYLDASGNKVRTSNRQHSTQ